MRTRRCTWPVVLIAMMLSAGYAHAQTVRGRLLEGESKQPVPLGSVALIDTAGRVIDQTVSNEKGHFELRSPTPGSFYIAAEKIGYRRAADGIIELPAGASMSIDFFIRSNPFVLDSIQVIGERRPTEIFLANQGFYDRQKMGFGYFITPEHLQNHPPMTFQHLFQRNALQVDISSLSGMGAQLRLKSMGRLCTPLLYIDGVRMAGSVTLDEVIGVHDIAAVEIYNRATNVPLEYGGLSGGCVVLLWTWHGVSTPRR